ncbi:hypothetical protein [Actinoplanes sp. CA-252034]|uniref:hypothetical protein n=1 Tax=Actinoplanes sp. CA-252034 TaxID=3239906 RepID=UPI003D97A351
MSRPARRKRRSAKTVPSRARGITTAPPASPPEPPVPSIGRVTLGALAWLVGSVTYFVLFAVRETTARAYVDGVRGLTGGNPQAMAIAGWVIVFAVFGLGWALVLLWKRVHRGWCYTIGAAAVAVSPTALVLFPFDDFPIVHLISGAGGAAFVHGMRWAAPAGVIPVLVVPFALAKNAPRGPTTAVVALCVLITLIAAALTV